MSNPNPNTINVTSGRLYRADIPAKYDGNTKETRKAFSQVILIDDESAHRYRLAENKGILELVNRDQGYRVFLRDINLELATDPTTGAVREATSHTREGYTTLWQTAKVLSVAKVQLREPWQGDVLTQAIQSALGDLEPDSPLLATRSVPVPEGLART